MYFVSVCSGKRFQPSLIFASKVGVLKINVVNEPKVGCHVENELEIS